jgi:hypothetical protein
MIGIHAPGGGVHDFVHVRLMAGFEHQAVEHEVGRTRDLVEVDVATAPVIGG